MRAMDLPFSQEEFLGVFAEYNRAVWPAQMILFELALAGLFFATRRGRHSGRVVAFVLALLWLWMGAVYHLTFFTSINKAAYLFGPLFILQGLLFAAAGLGGRPVAFRFRPDSRWLAGLILFAYSLLVYPLLGYALGHAYPATPTFGLPCPTTIYTFGMLLWEENGAPVRLLLIPVAWALVATSAALSLGMKEDFGLTVAAAASILLIVLRNRSRRVRGGFLEAAR